jgi:hypothetical protein
MCDIFISVHKINQTGRSYMEFLVIDNNTGEEADEQQIALKEQWADGLMYPDMDGFAIMQDGSLILMDECGQFRYCPEGRFTVVFREETL